MKYYPIHRKIIADVVLGEKMLGGVAKCLTKEEVKDGYSGTVVTKAAPGYGVYLISTTMPSAIPYLHYVARDEADAHKFHRLLEHIESLCIMDVLDQ